MRALFIALLFLNSVWAVETCDKLLVYHATDATYSKHWWAQEHFILGDDRILFTDNDIAHLIARLENYRHEIDESASFSGPTTAYNYYIDADDGTFPMHEFRAVKKGLGEHLTLKIRTWILKHSAHLAELEAPTLTKPKYAEVRIYLDRRMSGNRSESPHVDGSVFTAIMTLIGPTTHFQPAHGAAPISGSSFAPKQPVYQMNNRETLIFAGFNRLQTPKIHPLVHKAPVKLDSPRVVLVLRW